MYIPAHFRAEDTVRLHALMQEYSFATLVTQGNRGLFATHLPLLLHPEEGEHGLLRGHLARANPHWQELQAEQEVLAMFQGPHAYVSPTWYLKQPSVPTWNYAVVHAYGLPRLLSETELQTHLLTVATRYEQGPDAWSGELPDDYLAAMMRALVGIEIRITRLEGKFKMSQNQSAEDQARVIAALSDSPHDSDQATANLMRSL